jgi:hypothetical protein
MAQLRPRETESREQGVRGRAARAGREGGGHTRSHARGKPDSIDLLVGWIQVMSNDAL